jgi:hypothetical protein
MAHPAHVHRELLVAPAFSSGEESLVRCELSGVEKQLLDAGLAIG